MFATPPTPQKHLLSAKEVKHLHGKLGSLKLLQKKPRAALPEIQLHIKTVYETIMAVISARRAINNVNNRSRMANSMKRIARLEHVVIKFVINGYKLQDAVAESQKL